MAITITLGDISVSCDTTDEASVLLRELKKPSESIAKLPEKECETPLTSTSTEDEKLTKLWGGLTEESKRFCRSVSHAEGGSIEASKLADAMNTDISQMSWIRRRFNDAATKCGLSGEAIVSITKVTGDDGKLKTAYNSTKPLAKLVKPVSDFD